METTRRQESFHATTAWSGPPSEIIPAVLAGAAWRPAAEPGSTETAAGSRSTPRAGASRVVEGEVRGMESRREDDAHKRGWEVWTFRVERFDDRGNRLQPVAVMMRGRCFSGFLADGQIVRISRYQRRGQIVRTRKALNVTTGAKVIAHWRPRSSGAIYLTAAALLVVVLALVGQVAGTLRQGDNRISPAGSAPAGAPANQAPAASPTPLGELRPAPAPSGRLTDVANPPARRPALPESADLDETVAEVPFEVEDPEDTAVEALDEATVPDQVVDFGVIKGDEIEVVR